MSHRDDIVVRVDSAIRIVNRFAKAAMLGGVVLGFGSGLYGLVTGDMPFTVVVGAGMSAVSLMFIETTNEVAQPSPSVRRPPGSNRRQARPNQTPT